MVVDLLRELVAAILALVSVLSALGASTGASTAPGGQGSTPAPAPACWEDELWAPVHYATPGAVEDPRGVTRLCVPADEWFWGYGPEIGGQ